MSGIKGVLKDGWHPSGRDGGHESWRGDFKGINQVAGWVGHGKSSGGIQNSTERSASRPISSLRDPSTFAPPPRRSTTGGSTQTLSRSTTLAPPPVPSRNNSTSPPVIPPLRSDSATPAKSKPSLPPRLPPRESSPIGPSNTQLPPPPYEPVQGGTTDSYLNRGAMNRLANAGVSVPSLGIQRTTSNNNPNAEATTQNPGGNNTNELQARFSRLNTAVSNHLASQPADSPSPIQGVTTQQFRTAATAASHVAAQPAVQQAVVNHATTLTAPNTTNNPTTPGTTATTPPATTETRPATSRADSFREQHKEQIDAVKGKLNGFNQKYGITKRINSFIEDQKSPANPDPAAPPPAPGHPSAAQPDAPRPDMAALNKRKPPPPPPPPKKPSMHSRPVNQSPSPPPLPLDTKPR